MTLEERIADAIAEQDGCRHGRDLRLEAAAVLAVLRDAPPEQVEEVARLIGMEQRAWQQETSLALYHYVGDDWPCLTTGGEP